LIHIPNDKIINTKINLNIYTVSWINVLNKNNIDDCINEKIDDFILNSSLLCRYFINSLDINPKN